VLQARKVFCGFSDGCFHSYASYVELATERAVRVPGIMLETQAIQKQVMPLLAPNLRRL
jgi:hypothetical protein